jgi:hypothetical protein
MKTRNFCGAEYNYLVYRHPDGRRRTPRKRTVRVKDRNPTEASEG